MDFTTIEFLSQRLRLSAFVEKDLAEIFAAVTPTLTRFMAFDPSPSLEAFREIAAAWPQQMTKGEALWLVVRSAQTNEFLGLLGMHDTQSGRSPRMSFPTLAPASDRESRGESGKIRTATLDSRSGLRPAGNDKEPINQNQYDFDAFDPVLGVWIKESAHGRGYGFEAVSALLAWAGRDLKIAAVTYSVVEQNLASRRIAERLGGTITGASLLEKSAGIRHPMVIYRIPTRATA